MSQASPVALAKNKKAGAYRAMLFFHGFFSERGVGGIGSHLEYQGECVFAAGVGGSARNH